MRFNKLYNFLTEAFSNYKYAPPKDKQQLLYDFYMLVNLPLPDDIVLRTALLDAKTDLYNYLIPHLKNSIFFAISAEFRHLFDVNQAAVIINFFKKKGYKDFIKKYTQQYKLAGMVDDAFLDTERSTLIDRFKDNERGYFESYKALKSTKISDRKIIELAEDAFRDLKWKKSYGGKKWADIAMGWQYLDDATSDHDKMVAIDYAYHLQHNTSTVFNKLKSYYKGGWYWVLESLNKRANMKSLFEIYDDLSIGLKGFAAYIIKNSGGCLVVRIFNHG